MQSASVLIKKPAVQITIYVFVVLLLTNLNAMVDSLLHPEIPYFDDEHLIVGAITGVLCGVLFGLLILHMRHLENALKKIKHLEALLPICARCKRIRKRGADPNDMNSWQQIESYISEKTSTEFTHGLCPECAAALYPDSLIKG
jgi:hypothetical protein